MRYSGVSADYSHTQEKYVENARKRSTGVLLMIIDNTITNEYPINQFFLPHPALSEQMTEKLKAHQSPFSEIVQ